jgi:ADP-heptose:LPS heptosyltransferase
LSIGQKILAIKLRAIGDTVLWTPALHSLRLSFPEAEIHTLTYASNSAILKSNPHVNVQHELRSKSNWELIRKLWSLRAEGFEWFLGFHATTSLCRWAWLTGVRRVALHHHSWPRTPKGSVPMPHAGELEDVISRDYRMLEAMGVNAPHQPTKIYLTREESTVAEAKMRTEILRAGGDPDLPRYLFLPGGSYALKRYPKDQWLPLAEKMAADKRFQPVVIGDRALSVELGLSAECASRGLPLLDQFGLREAIGLISRGQRAFSNDSAPGHIAVALGLKTSFAFGPGCIGDFHPYDRKEHPLFRIAVDCRVKGPRDREAFQYCTVTECSHHRCMRELKVDLGV